MNQMDGSREAVLAIDISADASQQACVVNVFGAAKSSFCKYCCEELVDLRDGV